MANLTISLDDALIKAGREMAERQNTSLNGLIRSLLERQVAPSSTRWLEDLFARFDEAPGHSGGQRWTRDELYDV